MVVKEGSVKAVLLFVACTHVCLALCVVADVCVNGVLLVL